MCMHGKSFVLKVLPNHCQMMVAERKRVDRLETKEPAHEGVPFRPTVKKGDERVRHIKENSIYRPLFSSLSKLTGNVASRQRIVLCPITVKHTK